MLCVMITAFRVSAKKRRRESLFAVMIVSYVLMGRSQTKKVGAIRVIVGGRPPSLLSSLPSPTSREGVRTPRLARMKSEDLRGGLDRGR